MRLNDWCRVVRKMFLVIKICLCGLLQNRRLNGLFFSQQFVRHVLEIVIKIYGIAIFITGGILITGYSCNNWKLTTTAVKTNKPSMTFCRSPGTRLKVVCSILLVPRYQAVLMNKTIIPPTKFKI